MKLKKLILIVLIFVNTNIFAQICANPSISSASIQRTYTDPSYFEPDTFVCINVQFHIVRDDNGSGGFNPNGLTNVVNKLNEAYNPAQLFYK